MLRRIRKWPPSPAMIVAFVALVAAMSGTAVALPGKNSVDSGDLKKGAVKSADIGKNAVTGSRVKNNTLKGADVLESSLGKVPSAANADHATTADSATTAGSSPYPTALGKGQTMKGVYGLECDGSVCENGFSFPVPLASRPTKHLIREATPPPAQCPGTYTNPAAQPGHLCVFEGLSNSATTLSLYDPEDESFGTTVSRFGFGVAINGTAGANHWSHGTWAVTAP